MPCRKHAVLITTVFVSQMLFASNAAQQRTAKIRDIATVEGVRDNSLFGYGLVVGLNGTGDRRQTIFTTQALSNMLSKMGVSVSGTSIRVNNVAAVFITASLPPFARPGTQIDVTVSSVGDAKSLEGGTLLMAPLRAPTGEVYATAQGPLTLGGYMAGNSANSKLTNHPTVGRVPGGATVERAGPQPTINGGHITLLLRNANFTDAQLMADAVNKEFNMHIAQALDGGRVEVQSKPGESVPLLLSRIENLEIVQQVPFKVVVNERTGTVVMGKDVHLGAVSILHGNLQVDIRTELVVSQPNPFTNGQTTTIPQQSVRTEEAPAKRIELGEGATVEQLVNGLQKIGATARDVISILQALKSAGALKCELEVL